MNASEIVVHEMESDSMGVHLDLLAKPVREPGEAAHAHPHCEVLPLDVTGRDMPFVRAASKNCRLCTDDLGRAIALLVLGIAAENLGQRGVINVSTKHALNGIGISGMGVRGQLETSPDPHREIEKKLASCASVARADIPARDELRVGIDCRPRPHVARLSALAR